jgi:hypothetical protein
MNQAKKQSTKPTMSVKEFEKKFNEFCRKKNIPVDKTRVESENKAFEEFIKTNEGKEALQ